MAHYAFLDNNNVVTEVITGVDENYKGFVIECYDDGTYMKRIQY